MNEFANICIADTPIMFLIALVTGKHVRPQRKQTLSFDGVFRGIPWTYVVSFGLDEKYHNTFANLISKRFRSRNSYSNS